jgi:hypothetical protein
MKNEDVDIIIKCINNNNNNNNNKIIKINLNKYSHDTIKSGIKFNNNQIFQINKTTIEGIEMNKEYLPDQNSLAFDY